MSATKTWAHHPGGTVRELIVLDADLVPGKDVFTADFAAFMTDATAVTPAPAVGWTTADDGKTFSASASDPAPTPVQLVAYASARQDAVLAGIWSFGVAAAGAPAHVVTTKLDDRGQFAMVKVQGWLTLNASNASASLPYSNVDFSATTLTVAEADSLVEQAAALDTKSYAILNRVVAGIQASPATITTFAQVDAAFAALVPAA